MKVAVGVITDATQKILITQRPAHLSFGGFWEFPGGKLENDEAPDKALIREIKEEVGLNVLNYTFLGEIQYEYEFKTICLLIFHVTEFTGTASMQETQTGMKWVEFSSLPEFKFPPANIEIISLLEKSAFAYAQD